MNKAAYVCVSRDAAAAMRNLVSEPEERLRVHTLESETEVTALRAVALEEHWLRARVWHNLYSIVGRHQSAPT